MIGGLKRGNNFQVWPVYEGTYINYTLYDISIKKISIRAMKQNLRRGAPRKSGTQTTISDSIPMRRASQESLQTKLSRTWSTASAGEIWEKYYICRISTLQARNTRDYKQSRTVPRIPALEGLHRHLVWQLVRAARAWSTLPQDQPIVTSMLHARITHPWQFHSVFLGWSWRAFTIENGNLASSKWFVT